ncbi:Protein ycf2 [Acorus calamus]|uniref:Protein ycf2 n=1 Tax=Acorus calamus TaxID=4465 RepID=A0AAV9FIV3_ACOCL|nr:Protein ycf2 [Acorus calamus]
MLFYNQIVWAPRLWRPPCGKLFDCIEYSQEDDDDWEFWQSGTKLGQQEVARNVPRILE